MRKGPESAYDKWNISVVICDTDNMYVLLIVVIPPLPEGGGGILLYLCPSVRPSFRPSKIFFVVFCSVTVDGRNLILPI
jgi:hypothetical protein